MSGGPDLFVVCKSCGSEVSPYITECPYCGNRLRKRAPKLERGGIPKPEPESRRERARRAKREKRAGQGDEAPRPPRLGRLRADEIPGIRADSYAGKPYGTAAIIVVSLVGFLLWRTRLVGLDTLIVGSVFGEIASDNDLDGFRAASVFEADPWRLVTHAFVFISTSGMWVALGAAALFGWLLERRHGLWVPPVIYVLGSVAGAAAATAVDAGTTIAGGGAGAMAMLAAWSVWDLRMRRREEETESDMLGVLVIACVVLLLPVIDAFQDPIAIVVGGLTGLLVGLPLARAHKG